MASPDAWLVNKPDIALMTVVAVVWAAVVIYATFFDTKAIPVAQMVTPVMLGVVGWRAASAYHRSRSNGRWPDE